MPGTDVTVRVIITVVAIAAIVIVMFITGWADDRASPGSGGRVPVSHTSPGNSP